MTWLAVFVVVNGLVWLLLVLVARRDRQGEQGTPGRRRPVDRPLIVLRAQYVEEGRLGRPFSRRKGAGSARGDWGG